MQSTKAVFGCSSEQIASRVILTPFLNLKVFRTLFDIIETDFSQHYWYTGFTGNADGERVTIIRTGQGRERAGDALLFLQDTPCKQVCFAGTAGGLSDNLNIGNTIIATGAVEIPSIFDLLGKQDYALAQTIELNHKLVQEMYSYLAKNNIKPIYTGHICSLPSIALQSEDLLKFLDINTVLAVDYETYVMARLAAHVNFDFTAIYTITDLPLQSALINQNDSDRILASTAHRQLALLAVEYLKRKVVQ